MQTAEVKEDLAPSTGHDAPACLETGRGTWSEMGGKKGNWSEGPHRAEAAGAGDPGGRAEEVSGHPAGVCELGAGKVGAKREGGSLLDSTSLGVPAMAGIREP